MDLYQARCILENMAVDMTGALAGMKDTNPMAKLLAERIDAIDQAERALQIVANIQKMICPNK